MADTKKKNPLEMTVKTDGRISNGKGGHLKKGDKFEAADKAAFESLKSKGLAE